MGSRTEEEFDAEEDIDPPPVPPSVLNQSDVKAAIKEMQLYFKAFQRQDPKIKADYRKYFKPVLCYMEAYWASLNGSDAVKDVVRAEVTVLREDELGSGAKTYVDPYSPTTVMKADDGRPVLAQWAHRTRCHPVQQELSLKSFFVRDDLTSRLHRRQSLPDYARSPAARFYLTPSSRQDTYHPLSGTSDYSPDVRHREMMEGLMMEVPGFNNYPANLTDNSSNMLLYQPSFSLNILNTAYYHRRFKVNKKGAMGLTISDKGFSDENMWVAQTTHEEVAEAEVTECNKNHNHCHPYSVRYTYALPLEVVWMTPLQSWNPYSLRHTSGVTSSVVAHQANGHQTKPYDGTDDEHLYLTPAAFYHSPPEVTYVKDTNGNVRQTVASGISTLTPYIPGVGQVRLRYPIMPLYHDGHAAYKEIAALKNTLLNLPAHAPYFENPVPGVHSNSSDCLEIDAILTTSLATRVPPGAHVHDLYVTKDELYQLQNNRSFTLKTLTTLNSGHQHEMSLQHSRHHEVSHPKQQFIVTSCDGSHQCWDGHSNVVTLTRRPHC